MSHIELKYKKKCNILVQIHILNNKLDYCFKIAAK